MDALLPIHRDNYAHYVTRALGEARYAAAAATAGVRRLSLEFAIRDMRQAFAWAGAMKDRALQSHCRRIINWLRADLRRAS